MNGETLLLWGVVVAGIACSALLIWLFMEGEAATRPAPTPLAHERDHQLVEELRAREIQRYQESEATRRALAVVQARHGRAQAPAPRPCPMCGLADVRVAGIVVDILHEDMVTERDGPGLVICEVWCPDCAPLITGGWIRAGATEPTP